MPLRSANRSSAKKPTLCGVNWYSMPGLPNPTISFTSRKSFVHRRSAANAQAKTTNLACAARQRCVSLLFLAALFARLGSLVVRFLLALLDDLGLGGSRFRCHRIGGRCDLFFLHGTDVGDHLVGIGDELEFAPVRQVSHAQHLAEAQLADVRLNA